MTKKSKAEGDFPTDDTSGRWPLDALLRKHGYAILRRRRRETPVWVKNKVEFLQHEALSRIDRQAVEDARYLEQLRRDGYE